MLSITDSTHLLYALGGIGETQHSGLLCRIWIFTILMEEASVLAARWNRLWSPCQQIARSLLLCCERCNGHLLIIGGYWLQMELRAWLHVKIQILKLQVMLSKCEPPHRASSTLSVSSLLGREIVALGGISGSRTSGRMHSEVYDVEKKSWEVKQPMLRPIARSFLRCETVIF